MQQVVSDLLFAASAARLVGITPAAITSAARTGRLRVAATVDGRRLFDPADVLEWRRALEVRAQSRTAMAEVAR